METGKLGFTDVSDQAGITRELNERSDTDRSEGPWYGFQPVAWDLSSGTPDFNDNILNANIVLRWEYLPGSTVYLVWTHERAGSEPRYGSGFSDDLSRTFRLPVNNVLLAKISYWWSL